MHFITFRPSIKNRNLYSRPLRQTENPITSWDTHPAIYAKCWVIQITRYEGMRSNQFLPSLSFHTKPFEYLVLKLVTPKDTHPT